jgi:hypothetical protein
MKAGLVPNKKQRKGAETISAAHSSINHMERWSFLATARICVLRLWNEPDPDPVNILSQNPEIMSTGERICQK